MTKPCAQDRVLDGTAHVVDLKITTNFNAVLVAMPTFNAVGPRHAIKKLTVVE